MSGIFYTSYIGHKFMLRKKWKGRRRKTEKKNPSVMGTDKEENEYFKEHYQSLVFPKFAGKLSNLGNRIIATEKLCNILVLHDQTCLSSTICPNNLSVLSLRNTWFDQLPEERNHTSRNITCLQSTVKSEESNI